MTESNHIIGYDLDTLLKHAYESIDKAINGFDIFDKAKGGQSLDLSPKLHELRAKGPVIFGWGNKFGDVEFPHIFSVEGRKTALVMDYPGVKQVFTDGSSFEQDFYPDMGGATLIHLNGPPHQRYRSLLNPAFSPRAIRTWEQNAVPDVLDALLETIPASGPVDLLPIVQSYPARVFRSILGLPESDIDKVRALGVVTVVAHLIEGGEAFTQELMAYLKYHVGLRYALPDEELAEQEDIISRLVASRWEDQRLSEEEVLSTAYVLVQAGVGTTAILAGNSLFMLLTRPDLMEKIRADRSLIPAFLDETLRMNTGGATAQCRRAVKDVEVSGVMIPAGMPVITLAPTANRDPDHWDDPDSFRLDRGRQQHMSFGTGAHLCIGMFLAKMEVRCLIEGLLDRYPNLRLDPDAPAPEVFGFAEAHATSLPVLLD